MNLQTEFKGLLRGLSGIKILLGGSTFVAGLILGNSLFNNAFGGIALGILLTAAIDGTMSNGLNYMLKKDRLNKAILIAVIILSMFTSLTTWFVGSVAGDFIAAKNLHSGKDIFDATSAAARMRDGDISSYNDQIKENENRIKFLESEQAQTAASILEHMNPNHKQELLSGTYTKYYKKRGYERLTASIGAYLSAKEKNKKLIDEISGEISTLREAKAVALSSNYSTPIVERLEDDNTFVMTQRSGIVWFFRIVDICALLLLWIIFYMLRKMILDDNMSLPEGESIIEKLRARLLVAQNKALKTETKLDDYLIAFAKGLVNLAGAGFFLVGKLSDKLSGWIIGLGGSDEQEDDYSTSDYSTSDYSAGPDYSAFEALHPMVQQEDATLMEPFKLSKSKVPEMPKSPGSYFGGFAFDDAKMVTSTTDYKTPPKPVVARTTDDYSQPTVVAKGATIVVNDKGGLEVIHNGKRRNYSWVKKQLRDLNGRLELYLSAGKSTTATEESIALFESYLKAFDEYEK